MDRLRCATCGLLNFATEASCLRCGRSLEGARVEHAGWDSPSPPTQQPPTPPRPEHQQPPSTSGPRYQDTARAGIWNPKSPFHDPHDGPPEPPPPPFPSQGPPYGQWQQQAPPGHPAPQVGAGYPPPYASPIGFGSPQEQAIRQIAEAQKDARNALIASLIGLVTFCCFGGIFLGIFGIVKGNEARRILDHYGVEQGRSMAVAATVVGALDIAITIIFLVANFASSIL
jgi:hypothetical protein